MSVPAKGRRWRKAPQSGEGQDCVEVGIGDDDTGVRDSKDPDGGEFYVDHTGWRGLLAHLKRT